MLHLLAFNVLSLPAAIHILQTFPDSKQLLLVLAIEFLVFASIMRRHFQCAPESV